MHKIIVGIAKTNISKIYAIENHFDFGRLKKQKNQAEN